MSVFGKLQFSRKLLGLALGVIVNSACILVLGGALIQKAQAQFFDDGNFSPSRPPPQRNGGFFGNLFGGFGPQPFFNSRPYYDENRLPMRRQRRAPADDRAPPPRKLEPHVVPTISVVVVGDSMADWLASGLENAFADSPEIAVLRKNKAGSGLVRYEGKSSEEWSQVARDILAQEKANIVVMMIGLNDRQDIRAKEILAQAKKKNKDQDSKNDASTAINNSDQHAAVDSIQADAKHIIKFRTEEWAKLYSRRINDTIAALKSKSVPVFWVGLPPIRDTKSTADIGYLNDLYRSGAERAGIIYVDIWDGFVDESGKYANYGPDYEGQIRRLRSSDGVFFTKYGARKLAHYVEREIRRYMNDHPLMAAPSSPTTQSSTSGKSVARPLAGPVVSLTAPPDHADTLLGGAASVTSGGDVIAAQVLVKGETIPAPRGRADNFVWSGANANGSTVTTSLEPKTQVSLDPANTLAVAPQQQIVEKKKIKKTKTSKNANSAGKNMFGQSTSMNQNNRRRQQKPGRNEPSPLQTFFPFFGQ